MAASLPAAERGRNEMLCTYLDQLGWSATGFARRVRERCLATGLPHTVSPSTVTRWRRNAVPGPELAGPACQVLSAELKQPITPQSLGWPAENENVAAEALQYGDLQHAVRILAKLWQLDSMPGRTAVRKMSFANTIGPASHEALVMLPEKITGRGQQQVTAADIELLEEQTDLYGRLDSRHGGGRFRSVFAAFLDMHATPLLRHGAFSERQGQRLYGSVADAVLALASMAYDDQLPGLAQRYDLQAMRLAQAIGDRGRLARGHIHQAKLAAARGDRRDVLTQARSAVIAAGGAPALVKAYAKITEARAWAFNRDPEKTLAAVAQARDAFSRAGSGADPRWLRWLDLPELEGQAAWAFAMAGLTGPGRQALNAALDMPAERTRDSVEVLITGAELARLGGDTSERAALTKRAEEASRHLKSRRLADRLARLTEDRPLDGF